MNVRLKYAAFHFEIGVIYYPACRKNTPGIYFHIFMQQAYSGHAA
jgi:hypothetical protein